MLKVRVTNLFTLGGPEDAPADISSLSHTPVEARADKRLLIIQKKKEQNEYERQISLGLLQTMTALQPKFNNVTLVCNDSLTN